eukprot:9870511-Heterocapsa_arctica.AAC.1
MREVGFQGDLIGPGSDPKETSQAPGPGPSQGSGHPCTGRQAGSPNRTHEGARPACAGSGRRREVPRVHEGAQ